MAPGPKARETTRRRRKTKLDWSTCWSNSLKEVAGLLPITEPRRGRTLTKKETLIHMLRYFDFLHDKIQKLQNSLPPHCLPQEPDTVHVCVHLGSGSESEENTPSEPCTPPQTLRAKRKYLCSRARKKSTETKLEFQDERRQIRERSTRPYIFEEEGQSPPMWSMFSDWSDFQPSNSYEQWYVCDSDSVPSSMDSAFSLSETPLLLPTPLEGNGGVLWSPLGGHCSVCQDVTVSESSQGSVVFDTPPTGPGSLLVKDRMLGTVLPMGGRRLPLLSPAAMSRQPPPLLPLIPLLGAGDSLNLSPSLLTSPARGLNHCLLPEGQEELQALFEDVWVTPKTSHTRVSIRPRQDPTDSVEEEAVVPPEAWPSSQSEGEEGDATWTPKLQGPVKKTSKRRRRRRTKAASRGPQRAPPRLKKKCVNGFIMFCRVNRKTYLRSHPGTPSTVVTKELASLWHMMPKQEKRVYCLKARTFSRQQNRNVRIEGMEEDEEEDDDCVPSPLHMLLAHRDLCAATRGGV